jgi:hypothetical protein
MGGGGGGTHVLEGHDAGGGCVGTLWIRLFSFQIWAPHLSPSLAPKTMINHKVCVKIGIRGFRDVEEKIQKLRISLKIIFIF